MKPYELGDGKVAAVGATFTATRKHVKVMAR